MVRKLFSMAALVLAIAATTQASSLGRVGLKPKIKIVIAQVTTPNSISLSVEERLERVRSQVKLVTGIDQTVATLVQRTIDHSGPRALEDHSKRRFGVRLEVTNKQRQLAILVNQARLERVSRLDPTL